MRKVQRKLFKSRVESSEDLKVRLDDMREVDLQVRRAVTDLYNRSFPAEQRAGFTEEQVIEEVNRIYSVGGKGKTIKHLQRESSRYGYSTFRRRIREHGITKKTRLEVFVEGGVLYKASRDKKAGKIPVWWTYQVRNGKYVNIKPVLNIDRYREEQRSLFYGQEGEP